MARIKAAVYTLSEKTNRNAEAKEFRENIRNYNNAFAFSSLGVKIDSSVYGMNGVFTFRIQGELCHQISSLLPRIGEQPKFAQLRL
jgi:hypothetical protein